MLTLVLFIVAAVLFGVAAVGGRPAGLHFGWAGAAVLALALALGGAPLE